MEEFEIPVSWRDNTFAFPARFLPTGYSYRIEAEILGQVIVFEPDEERNWRAIADPETLTSARIDPQLIAATIDSLREIFT